MDLNYEISPTDFTLQTLSAIRVAYQLLKGIGRTPSELIAHRAFENAAKDRIKTLGLPRRIEETIKKFITSINVALHRWHNTFRLDAPPILTPQGTVDWFKSTKAIAEDRKAINIFRFLLACAFCHEEQIFKIGQQLNADEMSIIEQWNEEPKSWSDLRGYWNLLARLWLSAYQDGFKKQISGRDLPWNMCSNGFKIAIHCTNEVAMNYFIDLATPEDVEHIITSASSEILEDNFHFNYSPSMYCLMFSKLSEKGQRINGPFFFKWLLCSLAVWPYQHFFLKAARSSPSILDDSMVYWAGLNKLISNVMCGFTDYDYGELFTEFMMLADYHWHDKRSCKSVVQYAFSSKYEPIIDVIMAKLTDEVKEELLMDLAQHSMCDTAIREKNFWLFELFVRGLGKHSKDLMVRFRDLFDAHFSYYYTFGKGDERIDEQRRFLEIVDKIMDEQDAAERNGQNGPKITSE